ncbi:MAG: YebC/PmpR family DNA-binding transcriptional regulator [Verrucomicrobia bacterium]|nr:YebC/PmpR family DNA-binding transcriptional regulator [Verrucomicrobiota bacterium]
MSGHSKWANIKHKKGKADAARGKIFSKIAKEIMVAASQGGGNPDDNITLRALVQKARGVSMPKDNIERAIKKGTGELEGGRLEEASYEGYAAGGIAVVVKVLTDNKNRSISEVRHAFTKANANMADQGAVSRMFQRKGQILIDMDKTDEESLMELALEAGAEDLKTEGEQFEVITDPNDFAAVSDTITQAGIDMAESEITLIPDVVTEVADLNQAHSIMRFVDALEELDDVQDVYTNFDISDEIAAQLADEEE